MKLRALCGAIFLMFSSTVHAQNNSDNLLVCTHLGFEPFVIHEGKNISGIDVDIVEYALKETGLDYKLVSLPWARLIHALKNGDCDVGFSLFDREDRRDFVKYVFNVPIHTSTFRVFVNKQKFLFI